MPNNVIEKEKTVEKYGYVRVSSRDQNADRQINAMLEIDIKKEKLFIDYESGKDFDRKNYKKMVKKLKAGDIVFIKAIDRLGRNYDEIIQQWSFLTRTKAIEMVVLDCPILDTRVKVNGLTAKVITDIFLQLLSYVAQIERDNIKQRQVEGIKAAKLRGVRFGRPEKVLPSDFSRVYEEWTNKIISKREAARRLDVTHNTFGKWVENHQNCKDV